MDTPARVALVYFCSTGNVTLSSSDAVFDGVMSTSRFSAGRFRQTTRLRIDGGEVLTHNWWLPEDWLERSRLLGGHSSQTHALLMGDSLRIEIGYIVNMDPTKSVVTFPTAGWAQTVQTFCGDRGAAEGD